MSPRSRSVILLALALMACSRAHSDEIPAELQQAKAQHQKEVDFALRPIRERYIARLETLKRTLAQKGDVRAAVAVQDEIDLLSSQLNEPTIISKHAGTWVAPVGQNRRYSIKPDGTVAWIFDNAQVYAVGRLVRNGKDFTFVWDSVEEIDRVTLNDNSIVLESFQPKSNYPAGPVLGKYTLTRTAVGRESK
jgi:hypothetical protein